MKSKVKIKMLIQKLEFNFIFRLKYHLFLQKLKIVY